MAAILLILGLLSGGSFVKRYIFRTGFFIACAIFLGAYSLVLFYLLVLGVRLSLVIVLFPVLFLPFLFYDVVRLLKQKIRCCSPDVRTYLFFGFLAVIIVFCTLHILNKPIVDRDGLGIWLTKAKMIYLDRTLGAENFFNAYRIQDHPRYPLLWPIIEAAYFYAGGMNERTVKIMTLLVWLLIIGILVETAFARSDTPKLLLLIAFVLIPAYYLMPDGSLNTGYADIPLGLFFLCAYAFLFKYLTSGCVWHALGAGFSLGLCMFIKEEGMAFALSVVLLFLFTKKRNQDILWLLASAVIPVIPWFLTRMRITDLYAEHYLAHIPSFLSKLDRIPVILKNMLLELVNLEHWGIFWIIIAGCVMLAVKRKYAMQLVLITVLLFIIYSGIFILTPWNIDLQMKVVFPRMLLHIAPAMVFLACQTTPGKMSGRP